MIFKRRTKPQIGDIKAKRKFLLLPRFTDEYWAWLGIYTLTYKYARWYDFSDDICIGWELIKIE